MPAAAIAVSMGVSALSSYYGNKKAAESNRHATDTQARGDAEALAFAKEQEARNRADWDAREARRQPYRQASEQALMSLSQLAGMSRPSSAQRTMPLGWTAGQAAPQSQRTTPLRSLIQPSGSRAFIPSQGNQYIPPPGQWEV